MADRQAAATRCTSRFSSYAPFDLDGRGEQFQSLASFGLNIATGSQHAIVLANAAHNLLQQCRFAGWGEGGAPRRCGSRALLLKVDQLGIPLIVRCTGIICSETVGVMWTSIRPVDRHAESAWHN
jgi:hypothetical protein